MLTFSECKKPARLSISSCQTDINFLLCLLPLPPASPKKKILYWCILQYFGGNKSCDALFSQRKTQQKRENISQQEITRASKLMPQFSRGHRIYLAPSENANLTLNYQSPHLQTQFHYALFLNRRNEIIQFCHPCVGTRHILTDSS